MAWKFISGFVSGSLVAVCGQTLIKNQREDKTNDQKRQEQAMSHMLPYGPPQGSPEVSVYGNHILNYDQARKIPNWVAEHLTASNVKGEANRKHSKFKPDPHVPELFTAQNKDYLRSGWSRGHMSAAGNSKHDQNAMNDSFFLSNVLPQDLSNNSDFWNRLEIYCRDLTKQYSSVFVISGPLVLPSVGEDNKKYINHQVIGNSEVSVPTHLYKIIMVEDTNKAVKAIGSFVVPNKPIPREHPLQQYQVPLEFVEQKSGFRFHPNLEKSSLTDLCSVDGCQLMSFEKFELYFVCRKLNSATTLHRLETVWKELEEKKLKPDDYAINLYNVKKKELSEKTFKKAG